jgi:uncharacterized protein
MFTSAYIFVTNRCNLACKYCYESNRTGDMSSDTMKRTIDWLLKQRNAEEKARPDQDMCITFFGGEPLANFKLVKYGMQYCKEICDQTGTRVGLYILTNGTILTEEMEEFFREAKKWAGVSFHLQVSIDGCKESHDKNRVFRDGSGSFDRVAENVRKLKSIFSDLIVRQTVVPDSVGELSKDFYTLLNSGGVITNLTPIVEGNWNRENIGTYVSELEKCIEMFVKKPGREKMSFNMIHSELMRMGDPEFNSYKGCRAGTKLVGISVDGDIYPCHRFIAYKNEFDYRIGNVFSGVDYEGENWKKLMDMHSLANEECKGCRVITCNRCYATNLHMSKSPQSRPMNGYCEMNEAASDALSKKLKSMLLNKEIGLRWGEMVKIDEDKTAANVDGKETEIFENPLDLMARCMVAITKEIGVIKSRLGSIEATLGSNSCEKTDQNNVKR